MNLSRVKRFTAYFAVLNLLVLGFSSLAAADKLGKVTVSERVDKDGDGYLSSFTVKANVNGRVDEKGNSYNGGVFEAMGEPRIGVILVPKGSQRYISADMDKEVPHLEDTSVEIEYDYEAFKDKTEGYSEAWRRKDYRNIMTGDWPIGRLEIGLYEEDPGVNNENEEIAGGPVVLLNPIKLEPVPDDKLADVKVTSNPSSAELYVNGEKKGETPWTGELPVDFEKRNGDLKFKLEKDGYHTLTKTVNPQLPNEWEFDMKKVEKPLVVESNVESAEVRVNGQKIGETPVSRNYWVEDSFDIRVEKDGYDTKSFNGVSAPRKLDVEFDTSESSSQDSLYVNPDLLDSVSSETLISNINLQSFFNAEFNASSKKVKSNEEVSFDASGSYDLAGEIDSYTWSFGDGTTKQGEKVSHSYGSSGNYTVNLTVENENGTTVSTVKHVVVENILPEASFFLGQRKAVEGEPVIFDGSSSKDRDGSVTSYSWDMGDGTTKNGENISHVYSSSGTYIVRLEVTDDNGVKESVRRTVKVEERNEKPVASFNAPSNVEANETVEFDASNSRDADGSIATYSWDFGDGNTKQGVKVDHSYSSEGSYTVDLTVTDDNGETSSEFGTVKVTSNQASNSGKTVQTETGSKAEEEEEGTVGLLMKLISSIF